MMTTFYACLPAALPPAPRWARAAPLPPQVLWTCSTPPPSRPCSTSSWCVVLTAGRRAQQQAACAAAASSRPPCLLAAAAVARRRASSLLPPSKTPSGTTCTAAAAGPGSSRSRRGPRGSGRISWRGAGRRSGALALCCVDCGSVVWAARLSGPAAGWLRLAGYCGPARLWCAGGGPAADTIGCSGQGGNEQRSAPACRGGTPAARSSGAVAPAAVGVGINESALPGCDLAPSTDDISPLPFSPPPRRHRRHLQAPEALCREAALHGPIPGHIRGSSGARPRGRGALRAGDHEPSRERCEGAKKQN